MKLRHSVFLIAGVFLLIAVAVAQQPDERLPTAAGNEPTSRPSLSQRFRPPASAWPPAKLLDRMSTTLLLVKSDWSEHEDSEEIEVELKQLLKDDALPELYRADLLHFAPRILFSEEFVSLYDASEYSSLLNWLLERKLARFPGVVSTPDTSKEQEYEQTNASDTENLLRVSSLIITDDLMPVKTVFGSQASEPPPPFVTYQYVWRFTVTSRQKVAHEDEPHVMEVDLTRFAQRIDTLRVSGSRTIETKNYGNTARLAFDLPAHQVALAHGGFQQQDWYRQAVRADGWEPIIYLAREDLPEVADTKPRLTKPTTLFKPSTSSYSRFFPRATRDIQRLASAESRGYASGRSNSGIRRPTESQPKEEAPQLIKVFALEWVSSDNAAEVLKQLLPAENIVSDPRTNAVIAHGETESLSKVEALLQILDREPTSREEQITGQRLFDDMTSKEANDAVLRALRDKYAATEQQSQSIAALVVNEPNEQATKQLRSQLSAIVSEAFGLRQDLQRAELKLLQERIRHIESQIEQRETLRSEIIRHRVDQLVNDVAADDSIGITKLNPSSTPETTKVEMNFDRAQWGSVLKWYADLLGVPLQYQEEVSGTLSYSSARPHTLKEVQAVIAEAMPRDFELVLNDGQLIVRRRELPTTSLSQKISSLVRPGEFRSQIDQLEAAIAQSKSSPASDASIARTKARLQLLLAEYETQVKIMELEVAGGRAAEQSTKQSLDLAKAMFENGRLSSSEMTKAKNDFEQARVRHAQAQALLDLYRKVDATNNLPANNTSNATTEPESTGSKSQGGVQIEALPDQGVIILRGAKDDVEDVEQTLRQLENNRNESAKEPEPAP